MTWNSRLVSESSAVVGRGDPNTRWGNSESGKRKKAKEARRSLRYDVDVPCTVYWKERALEARLGNLSYGGARITKTVAIPPKDERVRIAIEFDGRHFEVMALLTSRVVYSGMRITEGGEAGYFGVEFMDPLEHVRACLSPIFEAADSLRPEVDWRFVASVDTCKYCRQWSSMTCTVCTDATYVCENCRTKHLETHLSR